MLKRLFIKEDESVKQQCPEAMLAQMRAKDVEQGTVEVLAIVPDAPEYNTLEGVESITDFYERIHMANAPIYDVLPFIEAFPATMNVVDKKVALAKTLAAARMDVAVLKENANACVSALQNASNTVQSQTDANIAEYEGNIRVLTAEIERLRGCITTAKEVCIQQRALFAAEAETVRGIAAHLN